MRDYKLFAVYLGGHAKGCNIEVHDVVFVVGAYEPSFFGEVHQSGFYVASSKKDAQAKARKQLCLKLKQRHHDDTVVVEDSIADVDDCVEIDNVDNLRLVFTPTDVMEEFCLKCEYIKLPR
ncbi:hypothetical protein RIVM261_069170 [Rivularia sp. IAM M-261]|nr:hypothetical protein RIVM261_069170 [Rivularia sp. IAM M-261]